MNYLYNCINSSDLVDLRYTSIYFTWSNIRVNRQDFIEMKLDRALVNQKWLDVYPNSHGMFKAQVYLTTLFLVLTWVCL